MDEQEKKEIEKIIRFFEGAKGEIEEQLGLIDDEITNLRDLIS